MKSKISDDYWSIVRPEPYNDKVFGGKIADAVKEMTDGAKFSRISKNWCQITTNKFVLNLIKGIELKLVTPLTEFTPRPINFSSEEMSLIDIEVQTLLKKGAIIQVTPTEGQILSNIFLRPKKNGKLRPTINLKGLNSHLEKFILRWSTYHLFCPLFPKELS